MIKTAPFYEFVRFMHAFTGFIGGLLKPKGKQKESKGGGLPIEESRWGESLKNPGALGVGI